jgi:hypothetical protein
LHAIGGYAADVDDSAVLEIDVERAERVAELTGTADGCRRLKRARTACEIERLRVLRGRRLCGRVRGGWRDADARERGGAADAGECVLQETTTTRLITHALAFCRDEA